MLVVDGVRRPDDLRPSWTGGSAAAHQAAIPEMIAGWSSMTAAMRTRSAVAAAVDAVSTGRAAPARPD